MTRVRSWTAVAVALVAVSLTSACASAAKPGGPPSSSDGPGVSVGGGVGVGRSCVAPTLTVSPDTIHAGDTVSVHGRFFVATCIDTVVNGSRSPDVPPQQVRLVLEQGGAGYDLASAHTDATGAFDMAVTVPAAVTPGDATLMDADGHGLPLPLTITGRRRRVHFGGDAGREAHPTWIACRQPL